MKYCPRCCTDKDLSLFNMCKSRKDGRQPYCRECTKTINNTGYTTGTITDVGQ